MKKALNLLLLISSLIGYLEWGTNQHQFLLQMEYTLLFESESYRSFLHPFILLPLAGQILLIATLFQKTPDKTLTYIAVGSIGMLMLFICFIGIISFNLKILASTLPFIIIGIITILTYRKSKRHTQLDVL